MSQFRKTPVAARELGASYHRLIGLIRFDKITPPERDSSGDYIWGDEDLERARLALLIDRRRKPTDAQPAVTSVGGPTHAE